MEKNGDEAEVVQCPFNQAPLPIVAKLQAVNDMAVSKLNFYFSNLSFPVKTMSTMEDGILKYVCEWMHLNKSSPGSGLPNLAKLHSPPLELA